MTFEETVSERSNGQTFLLSTYKNSKTKVELGCVSGHVWEVIPSNLISRGNGLFCRECAGKHKISKTTEEFKQEVAKVHPDIVVLGEYVKAHQDIEISCRNGHSRFVKPTNLLSREHYSMCPECPKPEKVVDISAIEGHGVTEDILSTIEGQSPYYVYRNASVGKYTVDALIGVRNIAFDVKYTTESARSYHLNKTNKLAELGIKLVHISDYDFINKREIVISRILSMLGKSLKIYARNCVVKEISFPKRFLDDNHLQGSGQPTKRNYGLFYKDELVSVMTFGQSRFSKLANIELVRFATLTGINVVGGASKILKYANISEPIVSYAARDWSDGKLYYALGFKLVSTTAPGYAYYKNGKKLSRYQCQKHKLKTLFPEHYHEHLSEKEIMQQAGFLRVYDSGNLVFVK